MTQPDSLWIPRRKALLLLLGGAATSQTARIQTLDLFPAFFQCWKETKTASRTARARRFLDLVVSPHIELFDGFAGAVSPERAEQYLNKVEPYLAAIETLHKWVTGNINGNVANFKEAFPDFEWSGSVVFMPNFFGFDAGLGTIKGKDYLVFGLDTIAKMDGAQADLSVLTAHELFHILHGSLHPKWKDQTRGKNAPLYRLVWSEGLATYASRQLNPKADLAVILRSPALAPACQDRLKPLASLLLQHLDSIETEPFLEWMSGRSRTSEVPAPGRLLLWLADSAGVGPPPVAAGISAPVGD